jgi:hypothetical protein
MLSREHHGPRAILNAAERLAESYASECDRIERELAIAESQLRDYQARIGKPFVHDTLLSTLTEVRDALRACLGDANHELGDESPTSASELAERVKALKAANSSLTVGERAGKQSLSAEEPVTASIRRRMARVASESGSEPRLSS